MDRLARYSWFVLAYNIAVILWGAAVRATGSGAGCGSHWPLCNGEVLPREPRIETIIELTHRVTSGLAGVLVIVLVVMAFRARPKGHPARRASVLSLIFMITEGAVGAGLVLFELVADNQSMARALFMGTHLVNTFFLLAVLTLTAHYASGGAPFRWRGPWLLGLGALTVAGVSGAVAALGDTILASGQDLSPTAHLLIRLRILHPFLSVAAGLFVGFLAAREMPHRMARWTAALVVVQIVAGVVNVFLLAPVWMQIVHLLLADMLWIAAILLAARVLAFHAVGPGDGASAGGARRP
ncbi:MAG TPA: COX15/CtaA family protein [Thermoanaerobaculia bacterium]|nr:COX15/CtaA family protein [Thermoanaerobaculia bacterium]